MVAQQIHDTLQKAHEVNLRQISEVKFDEFPMYDLVILGTPSWFTNNQDGMPHDDFVAFMSANETQRTDKKFALFGLGDSSYDHFCGGIMHVEEFVKKVGGALVVPTLKIDGYYSNQPTAETAITAWTQSLIS
jgi:flavodoxin